MLMPPRPSQPSSLPSAAQLKALLQRHPARQPPRLLAWLFTGIMVAALFLALTVNDSWDFLQPLLLVAVLLTAVAARARWVQQLESKMERAQELAVLRRWLRALRLTWSTLPSLTRLPHLHRLAVALIAHCLDQLRAYDAAIVAYDHLADQFPGDHPMALEFRIQSAAARLAVDQLADADDLLQRLRGPLDRFSRTPLAASYKFARLFQQVRTNHFADALDSSDQLLADLRPLGVEAGYGHALMALCFRQQAAADPDKADQLQSQADLWWSRATLLLPQAALLDRFPELAAVANTSPSTHLPWAR